MKRHVATGSFLLLMCVGLMAYTVTALREAPYACAVLLGWLCFVEYALGRAWWLDVKTVRRSRS